MGRFLPRYLFPRRDIVAKGTLELTLRVPIGVNFHAFHRTGVRIALLTRLAKLDYLKETEGE